MPRDRQAILVTGISGNLGQRLAPLLADYRVLGIDLLPPRRGLANLCFESVNLGDREAEKRLTLLLQRYEVEIVIHLAFVFDPVKTGVTQVDKMWAINVQGTRRLLEAVAGVNQRSCQVKLFVFPSSVSAYGPDLPGQVTEDAALEAHSLPYAVHKMEADRICQESHGRLNGCAMCILRPHIYAGRTMDNFILSALQGRPSGEGWLGRWMRRRKLSLPLLLPSGASDKAQYQYVHVDDMARLLRWFCEHYRPGELEILNVAGEGPPVTLRQCLRIAPARPVFLPWKSVVRFMLNVLWKLGISAVPPASLPYFLGSYTMNTERLRERLGADYSKIMRFASEAALRDSFQ